jgi:putative intracellular protease/amidase
MHGKYKIVTVGFSRSTIESIGGLRVILDMALSEVNPDNAAAFILIGSQWWGKNDNPGELNQLIGRLRSENTPVAGICAATLALGRAGLYREVKHTSNSLEYLKSNLPGYKEESLYVDELAVSDSGVITASGLGYVEFSMEILKMLGILKNEQECKEWYDAAKHGIWPEKTD